MKIETKTHGALRAASVPGQIRAATLAVYRYVIRSSVSSRMER